MPTYEPLDAGVVFPSSQSDLLALNWQLGGIAADFELPSDEERMLRVTFGSDCIVRLLDEMALSTEDDEYSKEGLVSDHFAYRLSGARFAVSQSEAWKQTFGTVTHYQFVTGCTCMDVLSASQPTFLVLARTV